MSNSPVRRPASQVEDFKARFGVIQGQRRSEQRHAEQQGYAPTNPGFSSRQIIAAIVLALLAGMSGAGVFWFAQDIGVRKPAAQQVVTQTPAPAVQPEKPVAPVVEAALPPAQNSSLQKTDDSESPLLATEAPADNSGTEPATAVAAPKIQDQLPSETQAAAEPEPAPQPLASEAESQLPQAAVQEPAPAATPSVAAVPEVPSDSSESLAQSATAAAPTPVAEPATEQSAVPNPPVAEATPEPVAEATPEPVVEPAPEPEPPATAETESQDVALATQPAVAAPVTTPQPAPEPSIVPGQVWRDCETCPELVAIVAPRVIANGSAVQFAAGNETTGAQPFAVGRFEITSADWSQCVAGGGCQALPPNADSGDGTRPAINVSYQVIDEQYLPWLSKISGKTYRLPTSQEWDIAEAGGEAGVNRGLIAPDYQALCNTANYAPAAQAGTVPCNDPFPQSAPVGSYQSNAIGMHDMRGNVWEWVSDCWTPGFNYKTKPSERDCRKHVVRGGSWSSQPALGAVAPKGFEDQARASKTIGFRIARSLP